MEEIAAEPLSLVVMSCMLIKHCWQVQLRHFWAPCIFVWWLLCLSVLTGSFCNLSEQVV